jgi:hypothetical protein
MRLYAVFGHIKFDIGSESDRAKTEFTIILQAMTTVSTSPDIAVVSYFYLTLTTTASYNNPNAMANTTDISLEAAREVSVHNRVHNNAPWFKIHREVRQGNCLSL